MFRRDLLCYDSIYCSEEIHFVTIQCTFSETIQWYYSEKNCSEGIFSVMIQLVDTLHGKIPMVHKRLAVHVPLQASYYFMVFKLLVAVGQADSGHVERSSEKCQHPMPGHQKSRHH